MLGDKKELLDADRATYINLWCLVRLIHLYVVVNKYSHLSARVLFMC